MKKFANYLLIEKKEDRYTISMTPELQDDIGTIGYAEFTENDTLAVDDIILNLEASKTVMSVLSPLAGTVVERNEAAKLTPTLLNSEKADENWIVVLADVDQAAFDALEDA
ncbi:glycine cleavage system protein H [Streptococcus dysgalactiae]|uniref:Glycine cleavage system H protein n=1 Tax=Streptococcus dysgalactiae subsp. equisimilis TaxID=119602 RepID=A0AAE9QXT4_STREQ|nr:glycine cleavage system protein H [Streptococcus dysgalactiae]MCY7208846.1 glycine cleavage system protein H [Streptococcus dysgalactiae]OBZ00284.1 glycine cleavage system protein H [Streptococcus dysgalactiae subsp. equisimilis]OCX02795.1 glycine cleavage system protein H [Streptococcus dysgalactiae subsp. equisimilis]OCX06364.1 glycine cleavage system protein H [Streptococcus dysgalactiae subsp. equisimilis]VTT16427.1 glycine cleavage system H protein [Streptococcus dysgalactiae]